METLLEEWTPGKRGTEIGVEREIGKEVEKGIGNEKEAEAVKNTEEMIEAKIE